MDRHWDNNGAASAPTAPVNVLGPNVYPQGGVAPSEPGPWWYHMITEEMRNVVTAGAQTPARGTLNQLQAAISAMIAEQAPQLPAGTIIHVSQATAPTGYLKANGALVSRTAYAALFAIIGTTFGGGDGSTTFNLPDLRGEFIRGFDDGRGADPGRTLGSWQVATAFWGDWDGANPPSFNLNDPTQKTVLGFDVDTAPANATPITLTSSASSGSTATTGMHAYGSASTATDFARTRPRNVSLLACIKF